MSKINTYDPSTHVAMKRENVVLLARAATGSLAERRTLVHHLVRVAAYLGIGALVHAWLIGPDFDSGSLWSWGYVAMWPIPLAFWFVVQAAVFGLYVMLVIVTCALLFAVAALAHDAHQKRKERRRAAAMWKPSFTDPRD